MQKIITFLAFFVVIASGRSQDSLQVNPPQIITKLKIGQSVSVGSQSLKFIGVAEDSRCPSDVSCFWEGQVKIMVALYDSEKLLEEKELIFKGKGANLQPKKGLFDTKDKNVYGYSVSPYPSSSTPIASDDYYLELIVK